MPEERGARIAAIERLGELLHRRPLLPRELLRDVDADPVVDVSAPRSLGPRRPLAAQPLDRAVLRSGERLIVGAVQRGHLDVAALDRLGHGDRQVDLEVAVGTLLEDRRGSNPALVT